MKILFVSACMLCSAICLAQSPCGANPVYRQFDFWVGTWEAYGPAGKKAGDSKISLILDSCVVLEEWTSAGKQNGLTYSGKSLNTYNSNTGQWQQTWMDNTGAAPSEYSIGKFDNNKMVFRTQPFPLKKDTMAIRSLTFFYLGPDKVRQLGEISTNNGVSWKTEYDLEYRRRK